MMIDRQWKLVNEQHGGVNVTDWILNRVYRKKKLSPRLLDYAQLRCTVYLHNLFTTPATDIWHTTSPLFYATKSTLWPTAATFSYRNTQPHFTLFHYNSLISLSGILQQDHRGRLYIVALPHHVHRKISSWLEHYHFS